MSTLRVTTAVHQTPSRSLAGVGVLFALIVVLLVFLQLQDGLGGTALLLLAPLAVVVITWYSGRSFGVLAAITTAILANMLVPEEQVFAGSSRTLLLFVATGQLVLTALLTGRMHQAFRIADDARVHAQHAAQQREDQLAMATHELRTPLTSLFAYALLVSVRLRNDPRGAAEANAMVVHEAEQAAHLITKLLESPAARNGAMVVDHRLVDLGAIARAALGAVRPAAEGHHELRSVIAASAPVMGDDTRLEELLVNLLENALKYTPDGTLIELSVTVEGQQVVARVRDEGLGIPAPHRSKIFERFYRVRHGASGGTGLGLYLARQIARAHGGDLVIESTGERGSVFALRLPRAEGNQTPANAQAEYRGWTPRHVLLVEDDEGVREAVETVLHLAGHECRVASTSNAALAIVEGWQPDVILLDQLRTQPEFASTYRELPWPHAPILALTAAWDAEEWAQSIGAVATVPKPFEIDELLASIERYGLRSEQRGHPRATLAT